MEKSKRKDSRKKGFKVPHTYVLIICMLILATALTYLIPAGAYDRVEDPNTGRNIPDVGTFENLESTPVNFFDMIQSIPKGMVNAASIVFFVFIIGGSFAMIQSTGAIDAGVVKLIDKLKDKEKVIIPVVMFLFSILGFTIGAAEEVIPFIPIAIMIARGFGYDDIVGVAMVSTGAAAGFSGGMLNPFTTGISQGIAELPLYSGILLRTIGYIIFYLIAVLYVMRYAAKVKADPTQSVLYGLKTEKIHEDKSLESLEFTNRHKLTLLAVTIGLGIMIYGVLKHGWYINQISAMFIIIAVAAIFVGGVNTTDAANAFVKGAKEIAFGAIVIGLARSVLVVLEQGKILDSIVFYSASALEALPRQVTSVGIFSITSIINFVIPSGSGLNATLMPIMAPLADVVGITRQTAVLAVTYGDAFTNQIIPTSGALLGALGIANVPYERWIKYNWKLAAIWTIAGTIILIIATTINYGPF